MSNFTDFLKKNWYWAPIGVGVWALGVNHIWSRDDDKPETKLETEVEKPAVLKTRVKPAVKPKVKTDVKAKAKAAPVKEKKPAAPVKPVAVAKPEIKNDFKYGKHANEVDPSIWYVRGDNGLYYKAGRPNELKADGALVAEPGRWGKQILTEYNTQAVAKKAEDLVYKVQELRELEAKAHMLERKNALYEKIKVLEAKSAPKAAPAVPAAAPAAAAPVVPKPAVPAAKPKAAAPKPAAAPVAAKPVDDLEVICTVNKKQIDMHKIPFELDNFKMAYIVKTEDADVAKVGKYYAKVVFTDGTKKDMALTDFAVAQFRNKLGYDL